MKIILINRDFGDDKQSLGVCYVKDDKGEVIFKSECIERGWLDNKKNISCIPQGEYPVTLEYSDKFKKDLYEIKSVDGRAECKFHAANYARQLNGCIALGKQRIDIDKDGYTDISDSKNTMKAFHQALDGDVETVVMIRWV